MPLEVETTYENGVRKPDAPLPLGDRERVKVRIESRPGGIRQSAGLVPFHGGPEALDYLLGSENHPWERP